MNENVREAIEALKKLNPKEIQYVLLELMIEEKLNFLDLNAAYINFLEYKKKDNTALLGDSNSCLTSLLIHLGKETRESHDDIHWALHILNESKGFNMRALNERFGYDPEKDKNYSPYWRDKNGK